MAIRTLAFRRCIAAAVSSMFFVPHADALSISESNVYRYTWNGVIHHEVGAASSYFVVNDYGGDANSTDLNYALASNSASLFSLTANSYVDGTQIGPLGLDYAIAEASTRYDADIVFEGGTGSFYVLLATIVETDHWSTGDESWIGLESWGIGGIATDPLAVVQHPDGSRTYNLEYGVPYRFRSHISAYSRAELGYQTERRRTLTTYVTVVPEPSTGALVACGLLALAGSSRSRASRRLDRSPPNKGLQLTPNRDSQSTCGIVLVAGASVQALAVSAVWCS
jgi:hypothetical protein